MLLAVPAIAAAAVKRNMTVSGGYRFRVMHARFFYSGDTVSLRQWFRFWRYVLEFFFEDFLEEFLSFGAGGRGGRRWSGGRRAYNRLVS